MGGAALIWTQSKLWISDTTYQYKPYLCITIKEIKSNAGERLRTGLGGLKARPR